MASYPTPWGESAREVPLEGLEPPTLSLGRNCSSIELQRRAFTSVTGEGFALALQDADVLCDLWLEG